MKLKTLMEKINKIKRKSEIFTQQHKSTTEKWWKILTKIYMKIKKCLIWWALGHNKEMEMKNTERWEIKLNYWRWKNSIQTKNLQYYFMNGNCKNRILMKKWRGFVNGYIQISQPFRTKTFCANHNVDVNPLYGSRTN